MSIFKFFKQCFVKVEHARISAEFSAIPRFDYKSMSSEVKSYHSSFFLVECSYTCKINLLFLWHAQVTSHYNFDIKIILFLYQLTEIFDIICRTCHSWYNWVVVSGQGQGQGWELKTEPQKRSPKNSNPKTHTKILKKKPPKETFHYKCATV